MAHPPTILLPSSSITFCSISTTFFVVHIFIHVSPNEYAKARLSILRINSLHLMTCILSCLLLFRHSFVFTRNRKRVRARNIFWASNILKKNHWVVFELFLCVELYFSDMHFAFFHSRSLHGYSFHQERIRHQSANPPQCASHHFKYYQYFVCYPQRTLCRHTCCCLRQERLYEIAVEEMSKYHSSGLFQNFIMFTVQNFKLRLKIIFLPFFNSYGLVSRWWLFSTILREELFLYRSTFR